MHLDFFTYSHVVVQHNGDSYSTIEIKKLSFLVGQKICLFWSFLVGQRMYICIKMHFSHQKYKYKDFLGINCCLSFVIPIICQMIDIELALHK